MEEIWADVMYDGLYMKRKISNLGNLVGDCGRVYIASDNGAGYFSYAVGCNTSPEGKAMSHRDYVHRLVAKYFLPNPLNLKQVNHIDCDKKNNCVSNLEWVSGSSNIGHAHKMGRMKKRTENAEINTLKFEQVVEVYVSVKRDKVGISEMARQMGIPRTTASSIMNKRSRGSITNKIDEYLKSSFEISKSMPTVVELGLSEDVNLAWTRELNTTLNGELDFTVVNTQGAGYTETHGVRASH